MRKTLLLLFSLFISFSALSQTLSEDYSYEVGEPYKVYDAAKKYYFSKEGKILTVKPWNKYLAIQTFDANTLKIESEEKYEDFPDNYVVEGMVELQDKYYFFYSSWSGKKTKHERLYYREVNFETGKFVGEPKLLIDIEGKLAGSPKISYTNSGGGLIGLFGGFGVVDKFDLLTSKDNSKLMIQYRKKPEVKKDTKSYDIFGINVFDTSLNKIWANEYKMPYTERRMNALDFAVDSKGKGYILAKVYHDDSNRDKKKRKDKSANYHIELFRLLNGDSEIKINKIELKDKFINGISLFESPKDDIMICAGFYNKGVTNLGNSDGLFTFKISNTGEVLDEYSYEIPLDILNQYVSKKTKRKNDRNDKKDKAEFANLDLRNLIVNDADGSLILIGEQSYVITHYTRQGSVYYTYHYNDMLVTKIDASGKLDWMKKLPKRQAGVPKLGQVFDVSKVYQGGMSYSYFYTNGSHYLVFLDNVKNADLPINKLPARHSDGHGGYLTAYKIDDNTGAVTKGNILDTRNVTGDIAAHQFSNNRVVKTAKDEFVIEVYKKKKEDILIKVKIK